MSKAICRTCSGTNGNHKPSILDPEGIGKPGHKIVTPQPEMPELIISKAKAFEIDPTKKYILIWDKCDLSQEDALKVQKKLREWGADGISVVVGDTSKVKVVEL